MQGEGPKASRAAIVEPSVGTNTVECCLASGHSDSHLADTSVRGSELAKAYMLVANSECVDTAGSHMHL